GVPLRPWRAVVGGFEGHEERKVVQPRLLRGGEALDGVPPARRSVLLKGRERLLQQLLLVVDDRTVVNLSGGERGRMVERRGREQAILDQQLGAEQQRIAGEGGERLVGRVAVTGGAKRQDLPAGLAGRDQEVRSEEHTSEL